MTNINLRIKQLVDHFSFGNNSDFGKKIGINEANVRNYINNTEPKFNILEKIATNFEVNFEWLLTGKGEMLKEPTITERMDDFAIKNGFTLHDLGLVIGLSGLETRNLINANEATEEHINAICERFNISNDWFLTGKGTMPRVDKGLINRVSEPQSAYVKEDNKTPFLEKEVEFLKETNTSLKEANTSLKETNELLKYKIKSLESEIEVLKNK